MRLLITLLTLLAATAAAAQTQPETPRQPLEPRKNQKIERIVVQDDSNRIEELRVGGQTESVTVQPKDAPAYEIQPTHLSRSRPADHRHGLSGSGGQRVWNVFSF